jgi:ADP-ribose pyrophosphatase
MDKNLYEEKISSKRIFKGKVLNLFFDKVKLPNNKIATREKVTHPGAVAVVPVNNKNEVLLVKQYRYPVERVLIEIPAGKLDSDEPPIECAKRELHEEVGVIDGQIIHLSTIYTSPGFSDEKMEIYIALDFKETENNPDHDEFLHLFKLNLDDCINMIEDGTIDDAKSIIGIILAKNYIEKNRSKEN